MTHSWESEYRRDLASWLIDHGYRVRSNIYFSDSGRFCDLAAEGDFAVYAIETESNFESALTGISQAAIYAQELETEYDKPVFPIVCLPQGHVESPESEFIKNTTGVLIYDFSP